jgi:glycosyltransferase 2 family protein
VSDPRKLASARSIRPQTRAVPGGSSWLLMSLKIAFTVIVLALLLRSVDLAAAWKYAVQQDFRFLLLAAALVVLQIVCGATRWFVILHRLRVEISFTETVRIYYISIFFSTCLLASIGGDVARVWLAYSDGARASTAAISVILDRVAALAGVAIIVVATSPLFITIVGHDHVVPAMTLIILAAVGLLGIAVVAQLDRMPIGQWSKFRIVRQLAALAAATRTIFLRPVSAVPVLALGAATQIGSSLTTFAIGRSLGLGITPLDCLILMQPVTLLATLPISIGGWGVREAAMVTFLGFVGVSPSAAVVLSIQVGLLAVVLSLPGAVLFLLWQARMPAPSPAGESLLGTDSRRGAGWRRPENP